MFKNSSPQTKSFSILLIVAIIGIIAAFWVFPKIQVNPKNVNTDKKETTTIPSANTAQAEEPKPLEPEVDTSGWKTFNDSKYNFSFKHDPEWSVKPWKKNSDGFDVLEINPGRKYYNIKIYASPESFYVMDGLKTEEIEIGGIKGVRVSNMLYGVVTKTSHFTFDVGVSLSLTPKFNALIKTVNFQ